MFITPLLQEVVNFYRVPNGAMYLCLWLWEKVKYPFQESDRLMAHLGSTALVTSPTERTFYVNSPHFTFTPC